MKSKILFILTLVISVFIEVQAASFDCDKAATKIEKMICSDKELGSLDEDLLKAYKLNRAALDNEQKQILKKDQRAWLRKRNKECINTRICKTVYSQRVSDLLSNISDDGHRGTYSDLQAKGIGRSGELLLFPVNNSTYLFSLKLSQRNSGHAFGTISIKDNVGIYETNEFNYNNVGCKWEIAIDDENIIISTIDYQNSCGFGANVYADGRYTRQSSNIPESYFDIRGNPIKFSTHIKK